MIYNRPSLNDLVTNKKNRNSFEILTDKLLVTSL